MMLWALCLLVLATVFYPYLEMEAHWRWLLISHWVFQTRSDVLLAMANNYIKKSELCIRLGDARGAEKFTAKGKELCSKVAVEREKIEAMLDNFSRKYI